MGFFNDILWAINPLSWIDLVWQPAFGYKAEDYVIENPDDEQHYITHWGNK